MKYLIIIFFCFSIISCKTNPVSKIDVDCSSYNIKSSKQISWSERLIKNKFNKIYKEVRFCTHHPSLTSKIIYDEFGKWDSLIIKKKKRYLDVVLIWNNIKIVGYDSLVNIATSSHYDQYSTAMIFDNEGNDLLLNKSKVRTHLIAFFVNKMNERPKPLKTNFLETYRKEIRPYLYRKNN